MHAESDPESEATADVRVEYSSVPASVLTVTQPVGVAVRGDEDEAARWYHGTAAACDVDASKRGTTTRVVSPIKPVISHVDEGKEWDKDKDRR